QGSSREHAALVPLYLGIKAVVTKSFARIHVANLINAGIIPLVFKNEADYDKIGVNDELELNGIRKAIAEGADEFNLTDKTTGESIPVKLDFSQRQRDMLLAGGLLNYTKNNA
ncbi:MAG: aconitate hydratase, partial [Acutalibacteraceae bacterium]|nr:aconitate hydratase [Acutalibacteraceae bacterium]